MNEAVKKTLRYFGFFNYAPLAAELRAFLKIKASPDAVRSSLTRLIGSRSVKRLQTNPPRYTLGEYSITKESMQMRQYFAGKKMGKIGLYVKTLSFFPQIRLVGISGSVAMLSARPQDDIDLFIITDRKRLFTGRFIAIALAKALGMHRSYRAPHTGDKICLNLFFDISGMKISKAKRSEYVAHEVLQMKPLIQKKDAYLMYLDSNKWVFDIFPNANISFEKKSGKGEENDDYGTVFGDIVEGWLKKIQLLSIDSRRTKEIITDTQLWFFPDDFEARLNRHGLNTPLNKATVNK